MAHPSASFPKGFTYITDASAVTPQVGDYFTSILCIADGTITTLAGGGMYLDDGTSEESTLSVIALTAGMIIYGRFTSVTADGTGKFIAYYP